MNRLYRLSKISSKPCACLVVVNRQKMVNGVQQPQLGELEADARERQRNRGRVKLQLHCTVNFAFFIKQCLLVELPVCRFH